MNYGNSMQIGFATLGTFALVMGSAAHAEVLTYAFTGTVDSMFEHDHATMVNTTVTSSSFAGSLVSYGNVVQGVFSFDTHAPLSTSYQPPPPASGSYLVYRPSVEVSKFSFQVGSGPVGFQGTVPTAIVSDNNSDLSGWDMFYLGASRPFNPVMFQSVDVSFQDSTGTALSSGGMPIALNLSSYNYSKLHAAWLLRATGDQMHMEAKLTSLTLISAVPEPASYALLLLGVSAVVMVRRFTSTA